MLTAKLWGLRDVYTRKTYGFNDKNDPRQKKWQAPEILAHKEASQKSDVYVILFYFILLIETMFG